MKIAIQDTYGERFKYCWGCGSKNEDGLHLKSYPGDEENTCVTEIVPDGQYTGGVPANLFGGMIAMIFDCHGTASAAYFNHIKNGLELREDTIIKRFITARLEIDYKKPTPMGEIVKVIAKPLEMTDRKVILLMQMYAKDELRAEAKMVAVGVKDNMWLELDI